MSPGMKDLPRVELASRTEFRAWLEANAATSTGIWLAVGKKGNPVSTLFYNDAVEEAVCFGWIDATVHRLDDDRFWQLFTPRRPGGNWASSNKARVERLTAAGLMTPAGLAAIERAKADGSWNRLDEIEAMVMPADLTMALAATPGAKEGFSGLADSERKQLLYWIATAKRPETRTKRIAETVEAAIEGLMPG